MGGGAMMSPALASAQAVQSSHQEPSRRCASFRHWAGSGGLCSAVSYQAFGPGGFTMPAICPPLDRTYRTLPPSRLVALYDEDHGTMWSLTAPTMYASRFTSASDRTCPAISSFPLASSLRPYRERR